MAPLRVCGLTKRFGETVAVDDLSFTVNAGEVFGFLGPNGAGKTTTIRVAMGFLTPSEGTVELCGADVRDGSALVAARSRVGYLPAHPTFDDHVTGRAFLDYQARLKGDERRAELLEVFDPPLDRKVGEYSTGNRQMLGLVQAFMHDPDLVVLDEPTAGLDPLKQEAFNRFLRHERERGTTVFLSSHVLGEVRRVCDRVGIIRDGSLAALESVETLLQRGGKRVSLHTADPIDTGTLSLAGVLDLEQVGRQVRFTFTGDYSDLVSHLARYDIVDLEIEEPPIEDVFMHYYGDASDQPTDGTGGGDTAGVDDDRDGDAGGVGSDSDGDGYSGGVDGEATDTGSVTASPVSDPATDRPGSEDGR